MPANPTRRSEETEPDGRETDDDIIDKGDEEFDVEENDDDDDDDHDDEQGDLADGSE